MTSLKGLRLARVIASRSKLLWLACALTALAVGLWSGLARLGSVIPPLAPHHPSLHGPLVIGGCLGTLISLEWALALRREWGLLAPALGAASVALAIMVTDPRPAAWLLTLAGLATCGIMIALLTRHNELETRVMALAALAWLVGNVQWAVTGQTLDALPWWTMFLVLAILGKRLEMIQDLNLPPRARTAFALCLMPVVAGIFIGALDDDLGLRIFGVGLIALAGWYLRWDLICRALSTPGRFRFTAFTILGGYLWLAISGEFLVIWGGRLSGLTWDAALHSLFLGFGFSMIFAHVPIMARTILRRELAFTTASYNHVVLLHLSLMLRVGSDLVGSTEGRYLGALLNMVAITVFLLNVLRGLILGSASLPVRTLNRHPQNRHPQPDRSGAPP